MRQTETMNEPPKRLPHDQLKTKQRVKKAGETYSSSEMSFDDACLEKSITHMRIKTVKESTEGNRVFIS